MRKLEISRKPHNQLIARFPQSRSGYNRSFDRMRRSAPGVHHLCLRHLRVLTSATSTPREQREESFLQGLCAPLRSTIRARPVMPRAARTLPEKRPCVRSHLSLVRRTVDDPKRAIGVPQSGPVKSAEAATDLRGREVGANLPVFANRACSWPCSSACCR
jgi:hypothetical protein